jgi:N-acetylmuramoyl-L-alanine amidase
MKRDVDHIIIHCSATPPDLNIDASDIDQWHRERGWWGNGYHYVLTRDGTIQSDSAGDRCRPLQKSGAHVGSVGPGWNRRSIGICLVGGVDSNQDAEDNFTSDQWYALVRLVLFLYHRFPDCTLTGHRDIINKYGGPPKACPSFDVTEWMEQEELTTFFKVI